MGHQDYGKSCKFRLAKKNEFNDIQIDFIEKFVGNKSTLNKF